MTYLVRYVPHNQMNRGIDKVVTAGTPKAAMRQTMEDDEWTSLLELEDGRLFGNLFVYELPEDPTMSMSLVDAAEEFDVAGVDR